MHQHRTVLAFLDDHEGRTEFENLAGRGERIADPGELLGLRVVDHHAVDALEEGMKLGVRDLDPEIHGVHDGEGAIGKLVEEGGLHRGVRVREEDQPTVTERLGNLRRGLLEDAQLGERGLAHVHVVEVATPPGEGSAFGTFLEAGKIHVAEGFEQGPMLARPVPTHRTDQPDRALGAGCRGEVGGGPAGYAFRSTVRGVDGVDA